MVEPRPSIFEYNDANQFVRDMLNWKKSNFPEFSVARSVENLRRCSPTLVSLIARGRRRVSPDRIDDLSALLSLDDKERKMLAQMAGVHEPLRQSKTTRPTWIEGRLPARRERKRAKEGLLRPWYHLYLWDAARLADFAPEATHLFRLLRGLASPAALARGLQFLLREGLLRRTLDGRVVQDTPSLETTDEVPSESIRILHKKALAIAARGIDSVPVGEREASLILLPLDERNLDQLKIMIKNFAEQVTRFSEEQTTDSERLYQVVVNLCPISVKPRKDK